MVGLPAAAAGSVGVFLSSAPGLKGFLWPRGLRLRLASEVLVDGDLERWSKREASSFFARLLPLFKYACGVRVLVVLAIRSCSKLAVGFKKAEFGKKCASPAYPR